MRLREGALIGKILKDWLGRELRDTSNQVFLGCTVESSNGKMTYGAHVLYHCINKEYIST